ncbi:mating type protein MAT-1-1 [Gaeumannomyces hyphopodioides]
MSSSTILPDNDQVRQIITSLSPDAIARLIPQETIQELLRTQGPGGKNQGLPPTANQSVSTTTRKKKVNGFMAFRSYYAGMFQDRPQKERSPLLTTLWQTDPFRSRWTMMASAFSRVRDSAGITKGRMAMSGFLRVACPLMGIPKPSDYMRLLGWQIIPNTTADQATQPGFTLHQGDARSVFDQVQTPMTELELLQACVKGGFPFENSSQLLRQMETSSLTVMTQAAKPSLGRTGSIRRGINQQYLHSIINDPTNVVAALLPPHENISNFVVDISIITNPQTQQTSPPHQ